MALPQTILETVSGMQTELVVFIIAVLVHSFIFGKHRIAAAQRAAKSAGSPAVSPRGARSPTQAQAVFAAKVAAAAASGGDRASLEAAIEAKLNAADEPEASTLEALATAASGQGPELARALLAIGGRRGLLASAQLGEPLLCACLESGLLKESLALLGGLPALGAEAARVLARVAEAEGSAELALGLLAKLPSPPPGEAACALLRVAYRQDLGLDPVALCEGHFSETDLSSDPLLLKRIAVEALNRGVGAVVGKVLSAASSAGAGALLRALASERGLHTARSVFEACPSKSVGLFNVMLNVASESRDLGAVELLLKEARAAGVADIVTFNTALKALTQGGRTGRGRALLEEIRGAGLQPNTVSFNELIDSAAKTSHREMWQFVQDMRAAGLRPNHITCSIVLKSIQSSSRPEDVDRALAVVEGAGPAAMDEVLLGSLCEACIRSSRKDALARILRRYRSGGSVAIKGAHTYGSLIRAYGFLGDVDAIWAAWEELKSSQLAPSCITVGCMVEAVAANDSPEAAHALIRDILGDAKTRPLVNSVTFGSVLKGYSHKKAFGKVWAVHEEMKALQLQFSVTTYNTLIDACARSNELKRMQSIFEEMQRAKIEPNVITYSTVLKGYCQESRMEEAFHVLDAMKRRRELQPDEVTFNTLLDGCARSGMFERGMRVFGDMEACGVRPSNFTISVLVKLANRSRRPDKALELADQVATKYGIQLNVHVFNNLIQASCFSGERGQSLQLFERMLRERVRPDGRTYKILIQGAAHGLDKDLLADLLRAAGGLGGAPHRFRAFAPGILQPKGGLPSDLIEEALSAVASACRDEALALTLYHDLRQVSGLQLNPRLAMSWAAGGCRSLRAGRT